MELDRECVKQHLLRLGYGPEMLGDEMIDEFIQKLNEDDDMPASPSKPSPAQAKRGSPQAKKALSPPRQTASPTKPSQRMRADPEDDEDDEDYDQPEKPPPRRSPVKSARRQHYDDDELEGWSKRIGRIQQRGKDIDGLIQECRSTVMNPVEDETVDVPLYWGTSERKLDPYPAVKKKVTGGGGFIRPPPVRASRRPTGSNKAKGRRLLYEERFPPYVPGPEKRRDALRWQIRQKLEYSDPKYRQ